MNHRLCVAPMLDWTDRHERYFLRLISRHAGLYTEMVTSGAVLHGDRRRLLDFDAREHPLALQLGGSEPVDMAECARIAEQWGYDEVNINVGCPSERVQSGAFGACLMHTPEQVARCVEAMARAVDIPVTVKCRIGVDEQDDYQDLERFVDTVAGAGCRVFIVHARKAWLKGLSPKQNREVPPLCYGRVRELKASHPQLQVVLNGGLQDLDQAWEAMQRPPGLDGMMLGRAVYHNPWLLAEADRQFFGDDHPILDRFQVLEGYLPYVEAQLAQGVWLKHMSRHLLGLFQGLPGARRWRRMLSEQAFRPGADVGLLRRAAAQVGEMAA